MTAQHSIPEFWVWFFRGINDLPGYRKIINAALFLHVALGSIAAAVIEPELKEAAQQVLLPLAGVFLGVSFAWGANAAALLQTPEIEKLALKRGGMEEYVFTYQLAMLAILSSLVLWGLAGLGVFSFLTGHWFYLPFKAVFYTTISITLRESWHVALAAQMFLLIRSYIKQTSASSPPNAPADDE